MYFPVRLELHMFLFAARNMGNTVIGKNENRCNVQSYKLQTRAVGDSTSGIDRNGLTRTDTDGQTNSQPCTWHFVLSQNRHTMQVAQQRLALPTIHREPPHGNLACSVVRKGSRRAAPTRSHRSFQTHSSVSSCSLLPFFSLDSKEMR